MASAENTSREPESIAQAAVNVNDEAFRRNREILHVHGFHTEATGEVLTELANIVAKYPSETSVLKRPELTFRPFYFFFYGSLQFPSILKSVAELRSSPTLEHASIKGWKSMMMGPFPALIPDEDSKVKGMYWKCEEPRHVANLRRYETKSYRMEYCEIIKEDGKIIENGRVFVSTLDMDYLDEGAFDLDEFKRECDYMFDFDEEEEEDC